MTDLTQYDLVKRITNIEDTVARLSRRDPGVPGIQILPNGIPFFPGGYAVGSGSGVVNEPYEVPPPTGLGLSWGSSFDTVFIDVSWSAPAGFGADQVVQYLVQATKFGGIGVPIQAIVTGTSTRLEPVEPNSTYTVQVSAITKTSKPSTVATYTILTGGDTTAPAAPSFPGSPVVAGILALQVRWNANTERDVANGKGTYRVVVSPNSNLSAPAFDARQSGTNQWVGNLTAGTPYYVGVYAIDSSGNQSLVGTPTGGPWTPLANVTDTSAFAFGGGNVVRNSGFEDLVNGYASWNGYFDGTAFPSVDSSIYHGAFGNRALKMSGDGGSYFYQDIALTKGTWILSTWARASAVTAISGTPYGVILNSEMLTGSASNYRVLLGSIVGNPKVVSAGLGTFDWTRLAILFDVITAGTVRIYCQRGGNGNCTGSAWFDEIQLEQGDVVTGYAPRPDEILTSTIKSTMIDDNAVTTPKLITDAVVAGKIAADAIGAREIIARSITADEIATRTLTANEIASNTITANEIGANTITANQIAANTITANEIGANAVTANQLAAIAVAVGKYIQSVGYVPNLAGWAIQGDGSAEFNNVTIRGTINAARLGTDLFDFMRPGGSIAARFHFTGSENRFYLGEGAVNAGQYQYYETIQGRQIFRGGIGNNPAWEFTGRAQFTNGAYSPAGYAAGQWGATTGLHVASDPAGSPDTNWGVNFGFDGGSGYTAFLQGYLDSPSRHVGFANMTGGVQQIYIDALDGNPANTRSLTRTGMITYSDEKAKTDIKPLANTVKSARAKVGELEPIRYKVRHKVGKRDRVSTRHHYGFGAEAVKAILPEAVHENVSFQEVKQGEEHVYGMGIQYDAFLPLLVLATQEQDAEISELRELVSKLTEKLDQKA